VTDPVAAVCADAAIEVASSVRKSRAKKQTAWTHKTYSEIIFFGDPLAAIRPTATCKDWGR